MIKNSINDTYVYYEESKLAPSSVAPVTDMRISGYGIMVSNLEKVQYDISLPVLGDIPSNLRTNYYDPVVETEPYGFYSISTYGNYELVFNKNRWYQTESVKLNYYYSVNGGVKISYIPLYELDDVVTPYFNEGLVFSLASSLPLVSSSYDSYYNQNRAQMKNQFAVADKNFKYDIMQHYFISGPSSVLKAAGKGGGKAAGIETAVQVGDMLNENIDLLQSKDVLEMNQRAKLADVGNAPDTLKQAGSDVFYDLKTNENFLFLNHYRIDEMSYNSICKMLERFGYQVNLYDTIKATNRVGWNYVELIGFDFKPSVNIMNSQENRIRQIFQNGVTLLHNKTYLSMTLHNYETKLD